MKQILTSIWFLGLIIAVPVIIFVPDIFSKYEANLLLQVLTNTNLNHIYFEDLDGDGTREKISSHKNSTNKLAFHIHTRDGAVTEQQNFEYNFSSRLSNLYFGDVNKNNQLEIYGFTLQNDSLFLCWFEPAKTNNIQKNKFISKIGTFDNGKINFSIKHFEVVDLEHDNKNEILISIEAGFSIHPRILVIYKPDDDRIIRSVDNGINSYAPFLYDLDNDGKFEIITSSAASDNLFSATGISGIDDRPWLRVFNSELEYFIKPFSFSEGLSNTAATFVTRDGLNNIIVFNCNRSREQEKIIQIFKFDNKGNVLDSTYLPEYGKDFNFKVFQPDNKFLFFAGNEVLWIDNNLKIIQHKEIAPSSSIVTIDTLFKKQPYYIAGTQQQNGLNIFTEDFDEVLVLQFGNEKIKSVLTETDRGTGVCFVRTDSNEYYYKFRKNNLYLFKYPFYFLIYLLSGLFIWFIQMITEKQLREKFELKNQVRDLELKQFKNQMDPHFMFNSFTTMASLLKSGKQEDAYSAFMKFTKLVRTNFNFANQLTRPLKEELFVINQYLEINKLRFKDKLEYSVVVAKNVPLNNAMPKMMLQMHIENALKHGVAKLMGVGNIKVDISYTEDYIRFVIEDNGIGREKASEEKQPSSKQGLKMLQAIYNRLNQKNKLKISQQFVDLKDEQGNATGTRVEISVPVDLKE